MYVDRRRGREREKATQREREGVWGLGVMVYGLWFIVYGSGLRV
jgi:hypothetical protein